MENVWDHLTGAKSRQMLSSIFSKRSKEAKEARKYFHLIYIDIDNFKNINDTEGHAVGDKILIEILDRMKRKSKTFQDIIRMGGDEFVIFSATNLNLEDIKKEIHDVFSCPILIGIQKMMVTASIGVSVFPHNGEDMERLINMADFAMYKSKGTDRLLTIFDSELQDRWKRDRQIRKRASIALNQSLFSLSFQPIISLKNRRISGAEALARWSDPILGNVSPSEFIPIIERTGQMRNFGQHILAESLSQLTQWNGMGFDLAGRLSINVSPLQLMDHRFASMVLDLLSTYRIDGRKIAVEITEDRIIDDPQMVAGIFRELRLHGIAVYLDDFGVGYSSLGLLQRLKFDKVKLDRQFVGEICPFGSNSRLTQSVAQFMRSLGLPVIVEGVENSWQERFLKAMNFSEAQGFLFSGPLSARDFFSRWLVNDAFTKPCGFRLDRAVIW